MTISENNIFVSEEPPVQVPDGTKSLGHHIIECLDLYKNRTLFVDVASGRRWTGAQIKEKVLNIATGLVAEFDFKQGTAVCLDCDFSDLSVLFALGVICAGGFVSGLYPKDPYNELLYLAHKIEVKVLFCNRNLLSWAQNLAEDMNYQVLGFAMDDDLSDSNKSRDSLNFLLNYDRLKFENNHPNHQLPVACKDLSQDLAFVCMSSGTTGKPKAIPASHKVVVLEMVGTALGPKVSLEGVHIPCTSPLDYVSGRILILNSIQMGYTCAIMNGFQPDVYLPAIEKYKCPFLTLGATYFYNLITYEHLEKYDISSLRVVFPIGAKITYLDKIKQFFERHLHIKIARQGYGASEFGTGAIKEMRTEEYLKNSDCCGKLKLGRKAKIVDTNTGELLGKGQTGALRIKTLFSGYIDMSLVRSGKQATPYINDASVFDEDGYYITGDLAYFDDNEELYIVGREKELMSCRAAKKVVPQELEDVIAEHPAVSNVSVLGIPSAKEPAVHCPRAFIRLTEDCYDDSLELKLTKRLEMSGVEEDEKLEHSGNHKLCSLPEEKRHRLAEDIMMFFNERVAWDKHLTGGIVLLDELPVMRPSGKVNKTQLKLLTTDQVEIYGDRSK